mgnify:CR=1 FL=1
MQKYIIEIYFMHKLLIKDIYVSYKILQKIDRLKMFLYHFKSVNFNTINYNVIFGFALLSIEE